MLKVFCFWIDKFFSNGMPWLLVNPLLLVAAGIIWPILAGFAAIIAAITMAFLILSAVAIVRANFTAINLSALFQSVQVDAQ